MRKKREQKSLRVVAEGGSSVWILTISNGAGHTRAAEAIASAIHSQKSAGQVLVINVADYMARLTRFTHVTAYLWLVKYTPAMWRLVDKYQKRRTHTSPEWYYRRGLSRLFELADRLRPCALITTEVGCSEIAALIKRDLLKQTTPLVAVNTSYDADRAWVRREVNLYCAATEQVKEELIAHGAPSERIRVWGVPIESGFGRCHQRDEERVDVCRWLRLAPQLPLIIVAGGSEGMGRIEETVERLLSLRRPVLQLIALTGRNARLRLRLRRLMRDDDRGRLRVLGWTHHVVKLMQSADLMVSKLGNTFEEAMAAGLPVIALKPPPGSEEVQYRLLNEWGVGRSVQTLDEMVETVSHLLTHQDELDYMRARALEHSRSDAAWRIAAWLSEHLQDAEQSPSLRRAYQL